MMWDEYGMGGWGWGWAWGFGALVIVGVVILVVVLIRMLSQPRPTPPPAMHPGGASSPKQILDDRYAKGEMTTEEYRERLSALGLGS